MKKETLEEVADKYFPFAEKIGGETYTAYKGFIAGAKWQQEKMYSEEDVLILLHKRDVHNTDNLNKSKMWQTPKKWFEQIKQKEQ